MFALAGSVLAALGHQAVADGTVPWRFVMLLAGAQFAAVWPVARRRFSLRSALGCALAVQGALHLALTIAGAFDPAGAVQAGHAAHGVRGHAAMAAADGHAWYPASAALSVIHVLAALAVAWLLHRADAAVAAALGIARAVRGIAVAVAAWVRSLLGGAQVRALLVVPVSGCFARPARARTLLLGYALVRRGPPGQPYVPTGPSPGRPPGAVRPSPQGASLCPCTTLGARRAVSSRPAPSR